MTADHAESVSRIVSACEHRLAGLVSADEWSPETSRLRTALDDLVAALADAEQRAKDAEERWQEIEHPFDKSEYDAMYERMVAAEARADALARRNKTLETALVGTEEALALGEALAYEHKAEWVGTFQEAQASRIAALAGEEGADESFPHHVEGCTCPRFKDIAPSLIADLTCPVHGVGGPDPGDKIEEGAR